MRPACVSIQWEAKPGKRSFVLVMGRLRGLNVKMMRRSRGADKGRLCGVLESAPWGLRSA
jgi:hypothetical protein